MGSVIIMTVSMSANCKVVNIMGDKFFVILTKLIDVTANVFFEDKCLRKLFIIKSLFCDLMLLKRKLSELKLNKLTRANALTI